MLIAGWMPLIVAGCASDKSDVRQDERTEQRTEERMENRRD